MTLCKTHRKNDPFVRFSKEIVFDKRISWKAKGLLTYAFSRYDDWTFYKSEMMTHASDGRDSFESGVKELEKFGYLHKLVKNNKTTGKIEGWEWNFFEIPITAEEFKKRLPSNGKPVERETPLTGKPASTKNDLINKNEEQQQPPPEKFEIPKEVVVVVFQSLQKLKLPEDTSALCHESMIKRKSTS